MPADLPVHRIVNDSDNFGTVLVSSLQQRYSPCMREHIEQHGLRPRSASTRPSKQTPETHGHRLLEIVVYDKCCRIGGSLRLDDLADSEIGDWTMPNYRGGVPLRGVSGLVGRRQRYGDADHCGTAGGLITGADWLIVCCGSDIRARTH